MAAAGFGDAAGWLARPVTELNDWVAEAVDIQREGTKGRRR
jgi:hypothetical protein